MLIWKMNNVILTIRISEEIKKELDRLALEENRSLNNFINTIFLKYFEKNKSKPKEKVNV